MKKYYFFFFTLLFFCELAASGEESKKTASSFASKERRSERLIYVCPFRNLSSSKLDLGAIEKTLAECLTQRKSLRFILRKDERTAELKIQVEILKYTYLRKDISKQKERNLLIDALTEKNQAALDTQFIVRNRKGFILWKRKIRSTFEQNNMTYEEALLKVFKKTCRMFINKCFGKASSLPQT